MTIAVSSTAAASRAAVPTTGRALLRWAEANRSLGPRGIAVWWCLFGWGCELGYTSPVDEWDREQVAAVWARATLWLAETRLESSNPDGGYQPS